MASALGNAGSLDSPVVSCETGRGDAPRRGLVQDWVQVAGPFGGSGAIGCAGSTKVLTATNQEVAGSSPAGRANCLRGKQLIPQTTNCRGSRRHDGPSVYVSALRAVSRAAPLSQERH